MQRQLSPEERKAVLEELKKWYEAQPLEMPKTVEEMIQVQCQHDELDKVRWRHIGKTWPGHRYWTEIHEKLKSEWEKRNAEEIARQDPDAKALINYSRLVDIGSSHLSRMKEQLPRKAQELASSVNKNVPLIMQAAGANMARIDPTAALKNVEVKAGKIPISV